MNTETKKPIIEVKHFTAVMGGDIIIDNISFSVAEGEIFVILGGSGCGKSTLLKHMIGLIEPASGDIEIGGENIAQPQRKTGKKFKVKLV